MQQREPGAPRRLLVVLSTTTATAMYRSRRAIVVLESNLGYTELHDLLVAAGDRRWG